MSCSSQHCFDDARFSRSKPQISILVWKVWDWNHCRAAVYPDLPFHSHKATSWRSGVRIPAEQDIFLFFKTSISALVLAHSPGQWVLELFPSARRPGHEINHPRQSSAEVKNEWRYTSASPIRFRVMDRENFTYTLNWKGNRNSQRVPWLSWLFFFFFPIVKACLPSGKEFRRVADWAKVLCCLMLEKLCYRRWHRLTA